MGLVDTESHFQRPHLCFRFVQFGYDQFRLSPAAQEDLIDRIIRFPPYRCHQRWLRDIAPVVRAEAQGHIGILRCFLQYLVSHFEDVKIVPSTNEVLQYYLGSFTKHDVVTRFLRSPSPLKNVEKALLEAALFERISIPPLEISAEDSDSVLAKRSLIRRVILVEDQNYLVFTSPLHRRFYFRSIFPSQLLELPMRFRTSIDDWLLLVLQTFEPKKLHEDLSKGSGDFSKEGPLQHAFWRGASFCLPPSYHIGAEVSRLVTAGDEVKIRGTYCWLAWLMLLLFCLVSFAQVN